MVSALFIVFLCFVAIFAAPIIDLVGARPPNEQSTAFLDSFGSASGPDFANAHVLRHRRRRPRRLQPHALRRADLAQRSR